MPTLVSRPDRKTTERGVLPDDFVSMKEVATAFSVTRQTVLNWSARGLFPRYEIDGTVRFRWSEIERAIVRKDGKRGDKK